MGDFNAVRHTSEKLGGDLSWTSSKDALNACCYTAEIEDLKYSGHRFTWANKNPNTPITRKLDRALINSAWQSVFPNSDADFKPPDVSDHCPILIRLGTSMQNLNRPFKFLNFLADHPSFEDIVYQTWHTTVEGSPLFQVCTKLKRVKAQLKLLN